MTDSPSPRWRRRPENSNWGDFGPDDQLGRLNLLTPERRLGGVAEIRDGQSFCLSLPLDYPGGAGLIPLRRAPVFHHAERGSGHNYNFRLSEVCGCYNDVVCDDAVTLFTQYSTQWDAFAHVGQMFDTMGDGVLRKVFYNGFEGGTDIIGPDDAPAGHGARRLGIEAFAEHGMQGRGVLLDLEGEYGRERALVDYDALMRRIEAQGAEVRTGDFLCLYTGFADLILEMNKNPDTGVLSRSCAVLDGRCARLLNWITDSGIVAICADNFAVEAYPARDGHGECFPGLPLHNHCLFRLGLPLGELWHFADLARHLRAQNRWAFFLTAPGLRLPGAVGSPLTPIATT